MTGVYLKNWQRLSGKFTLFILLEILLLIFYLKNPIFLFRMHTFGQIPYLYLGDPKTILMIT
jgi:hypothetical protein